MAATSPEAQPEIWAASVNWARTEELPASSFSARARTAKACSREMFLPGSKVPSLLPFMISMNTAPGTAFWVTYQASAFTSEKPETLALWVVPKARTRMAAISARVR